MAPTGAFLRYIYMNKTHKVTHSIGIENHKDKSRILIRPTESGLINIDQFYEGSDNPRGTIILSRDDAAMLALSLDMYLKKTEVTDE